MNLKNPYILQVFSVLKKIAVLLLLYSFSRILFYVFNASYFNETSLPGLLKIFLFGIRFDFAAVIQFNLLFIILYLIPFSFVNHKIYRKSLFIIFWIVNAFLLLLNFGDIEYFKYTSKRTTADIFRYAFISNDVATLIPQFLKDFWYIPLMWIATVMAGIRLTRDKNPQPFRFHYANILIMLVVTAVLFAGARGLGVKPVRIISAARYVPSQEIPLLINTPFSVLHTLQETKNLSRNYFQEGEYQMIFSPLQHYQAFQKRNDNVVILILESFSHEFIGTLSGKKSYTPFLDSLLNKSLLFENGFANCRKSIEAIPAILAGLPSLTNNSYISSHYAGNRLKALPYILDKHGYNTAFFHGGRNGTMSFDEFAKVAGFKHYFGMKEYKGPEAFDQNWGIFDNEFLQYTVKETSKLTQPFFTTVFTLSSHHPYTIPNEFEPLIPRNDLPQLRAIRYADMALRNYFREAQKQPWFNNTLFVLVADHTAKVVDPEYNNPVGTFRIPIAFYHPTNNSFTGRRKDIAQQTDIMPSVIHYLGVENSFLAYGSSIFKTHREPFAINFLNNMFYYFKNDYILTFDGETSNSLYNYSNDIHLKNNLLEQHNDTAKRMENELKAAIQDYLVRLESNKLSFD